MLSKTKPFPCLSVEFPFLLALRGHFLVSHNLFAIQKVKAIHVMCQTNSQDLFEANIIWLWIPNTTQTRWIIVENGIWEEWPGSQRAGGANRNNAFSLSLSVSRKRKKRLSLSCWRMRKQEKGVYFVTVSCLNFADFLSRFSIFSSIFRCCFWTRKRYLLLVLLFVLRFIYFARGEHSKCATWFACERVACIQLQRNEPNRWSKIKRDSTKCKTDQQNKKTI